MTAAHDSNPPGSLGETAGSGRARPSQPSSGAQRKEAVSRREAAVVSRETAVNGRERAQDAADARQSAAQHRNADMREANSELVMATLKARALTDAAGLAHRQQEEFLAMLAHELRNPLAPIRSAAALLARIDHADPALPLIREVIQRQVEHMARLLDDLLDASRVTTGKVKLQRRPIAVREFVEQGAETCLTLTQSQHQQLTLDLPATPLYVDGDPVRLAQVIGNLLHNAAKYTPDGGAIALSVRQQADTVVIRVRDNGAGIAPDMLAHVFDLFTQEDRSLGHSQGGMGIGLTVVRTMVEQHGGTVHAHSAGRGEGSEFVVTLPRIEYVAPVAPVPAASSTAPTQKRILLVDDNVDAGTLLAMLLRLEGHEVTIALDGPAALEAFAQQQPQVVLCDIGLPEMNGYEVAERMRTCCQGSMPAMIALTGYDGPDHHARSRAAGFDYHLGKPVDFDALLQLIGTLGPRGSDGANGANPS